MSRIPPLALPHRPFPSCPGSAVRPPPLLSGPCSPSWASCSPCWPRYAHPHPHLQGPWGCPRIRPPFSFGASATPYEWATEPLCFFPLCFWFLIFFPTSTIYSLVGFHSTPNFMAFCQYKGVCSPYAITLYRVMYL